MNMKPSYWEHFIEPQDQPVYPPGTYAFTLLGPDGHLVTSWLPGDHVPCWLDFLPNRDVRAVFTLIRGNENRAVPAGPLRQKISEVMWSMAP